MTLCAGVGKAVVIEVIELFMLERGSMVLGDNCEGLCGVWGWKDMVDFVEADEPRDENGAIFSSCDHGPVGQGRRGKSR